MTQIISSSNNANSVTILATRGKLAAIDIKSGRNKIRYYSEHIASLVEIDGETFRNAGTAAAGAIIGGVLTGGVGLLAGAAYGGRRKKSASYVIKFTDGNYIAITEDSKAPIAALDGIILKQKVADFVAEDPNPQPALSGRSSARIEHDSAIIADYEPIGDSEKVLVAPERPQVTAPKVTTDGPSFFVGSGVLGIVLGLIYIFNEIEWPLLVGFYIVGLIGWTVIWLILTLLHKVRS